MAWVITLSSPAVDAVRGWLAQAHVVGVVGVEGLVGAHHEHGEEGKEREADDDGGEDEACGSGLATGPMGTDAPAATIGGPACDEAAGGEDEQVHAVAEQDQPSTMRISARDSSR